MRWMVSFTPWSLQPCGKCPGIRCVGGWLGLKWYGPFEDEEGEILWMLVLLGIEPRHLGRSASSIVSLFNHELSGGIGSGTLQGLVNCSCIPFSAVVRSYFERGGGKRARSRARTDTLTDTHEYWHTHTHTHTHSEAQFTTHADINIYTLKSLRWLTHARTHTHKHTDRQYTGTLLHDTLTPTYIDIHTHTHTHIYTTR